MKLREKVRIHKKPKHLRDHFQLVPLSTRREMFKKPKHSKLFFVRLLPRKDLGLLAMR